MSELRTTQPPDLKGFLMKHVDSIRQVASATLTPERMVRLVCAAASREPKLAECDPMSILRSLAQAASMGMEPFDGRNEVHLVPRWNSKAKRLEATCLPGYAGLIRLATDTGKIVNIEARVVYAKDVFDVEYGIAPRITHKPSFEKDRGDIIAVYAVAHLKDGGTQFEVMPRHEVDAIKDRAKDGKDGFSPWKSDYAEMARKTAVRRLCKYLPKSQALANALEAQAKAEAGDYQDAEVLRPGDVPALGTGAHTTTEDGARAYDWSDEERQNAHQVVKDMGETMLCADVPDDEVKRICEEHRLGIGDSELTPDRWAGRFQGAVDRATRKTA